MAQKRFILSLIFFFICSGIYLNGADLVKKLSPWDTAQVVSEKKLYNYVPILCFHNIDGKGRYSIDRHDFRGYMEIIRKEGLQVLALKDLMELSRQNKLVEKPSIVVTIDDDFKNAVRVAAPILREYSYPATFFVYISQIQKSPRNGMSWSDLNRLHKEGFEIQNHSYTHKRVHEPEKNETEDEYQLRLLKEIELSRTLLEKKVKGNQIYSFAYPMGYYNETLKNRLEELDYKLLLTTDARPVDLTDNFNGTFHRFTVERKTSITAKSNPFFRQLALAKRPYDNSERKITLADEPNSTTE